MGKKTGGNAAKDFCKNYTGKRVVQANTYSNNHLKLPAAEVALQNRVLMRLSRYIPATQSTAHIMDPSVLFRVRIVEIGAFSLTSRAWKTFCTCTSLLRPELQQSQRFVLGVCVVNASVEVIFNLSHGNAGISTILQTIT